MSDYNVLWQVSMREHCLLRMSGWSGNGEVPFIVDSWVQRYIYKSFKKFTSFFMEVRMRFKAFRTETQFKQKISCLHFSIWCSFVYITSGFICLQIQMLYYQSFVHSYRKVVLLARSQNLSINLCSCIYCDKLFKL